jgi:pantothenate kinase
MNATFPSHINVTGQDIDISYLSDSQKTYYVDLFQKLIKQYEMHNTPRMILGFAGPTGAGKSSILSIFKELSKNLSTPCDIVTLGIDAYSYTNEYLLSVSTDTGTLKDHKGRLDTYDTEKLCSDLEKIKRGESLSLPEYSRITHNPVESAIELTSPNTLVLIEGLWLLYESPTWKKVSEQLDHTYFVSADKEKVRNATIKRHMLGGRTEEEATKYYDEVDSEHFDLVMNTQNNADETIPPYYEL